MAREYLGKAPVMPFLQGTGTMTMVNDAQLIQQSIKDILATPVGSRFFLPQFGSRINELLFEPNDELVKGLLHEFIREAFVWEGRVIFESTTFQSDQETIQVTISYRIRATNEVDSFVYPFYRDLKY